MPAVIIMVAICATATASVRGLRRAWRASSAEAVDTVVDLPAIRAITDRELALIRATDEEIESSLTADLFAGDIDPAEYRSALEVLATHAEIVTLSELYERP